MPRFVGRAARTLRNLVMTALPNDRLQSSLRRRNGGGCDERRTDDQPRRIYPQATLALRLGPQTAGRRPDARQSASARPAAAFAEDGRATAPAQAGIGATFDDRQSDGERVGTRDDRYPTPARHARLLGVDRAARGAGRD